MKTPTLLVATLLLAACGDPNQPGTVASDMKQLGRDTKETAKDVGHEVGESLSEAVDALDRWARTASTNVAETGDKLAQDVSDRMPELETLADKTKAKLAQGGESAKAAAERVDLKLAALKDKLAAFTHNAARETKEAKDDLVAAFQDVVSEIRSGLST